MRIDFYHLQKKTIQEVLPELSSKVLSSDNKLVILTSSKEQTDYFDALLWTFNPNSWLPHGTYKTNNAPWQPIWISDKYENPNNASIIMVLDGMNIENYNDFERCLYVFNGKNEDEVQKARHFWVNSKKNDCELHYWQQEANGKWLEKDL